VDISTENKLKAILALRVT